ncbi:unnamed protein product [Ilex paraguariensis]|uniref:C3H1-type domain-containing protein n=1 Tax=Ilex paraguariensis TaxID=185542 RepID=A0ABC8R7Q2_9AQUA
MCGGPDRSKSTSSTVENTSNTKDMSKLTLETEDSFSSLLELAANNDFEDFKQTIERDASGIDEVGLWYVRKKGSKQIALEHRTPLMVAATFGSVDVVKLIISQPDVDVNRACGLDKCTALHCAASGGSVNVVDVVKLLLSVGSDPNIEDANGHRPFDVIIIPPKVPGIRAALEELLMNNVSDGSVGEWNLCLSIATSNSSSPTLSSSPDNVSPSSPSDSVSSPMASKYNDGPANSTSEKREYPIDPSLPDIKNSMYSTDEFRMFSFKVRPCSRAYSHDWTECPFVHPGENARRRDPRKYHYSCVPCPDFRKGACRRGDMCEYAHGVFECWLHPAQYRTRLCKDGTSCARRVCFFAHTAEELRPLYVNTGSAIPSPRSSALAASAMDMAAALSLLPGSPSSHSVMSSSPFNQPMSPSANCISHSSVAWQQPNVPTLHLPGSNLQSSRLRSSFSARDIPPEDLSILQDFDMQQQLLNDFSCLPQSRPSTISLNRSGRSNTLAPSNLEEFFSAEMTSSPRYSDLAAATGVFSPSHKSTVLSQFQQQQSILSPINTNVFSPKNVEHPLLQASFGVSSPGRMSPRSVEPISPMGARHSVFAQREKQHQQLRSLSSRDLGSNNVSTVGSPVNSSWSNWGSSNGKVDWSVKGDGMGRLRRSNSFELNNNGEEPDLSWVQSLVKESPPEMKEKLAVPISGTVPSAIFLIEGMCGGPDRSKSTSSTVENTSNTKDMSKLTLETEDSFSSLLELAANNDFEDFKQTIERDASGIDEVGLWYVRKKGSKQIALEHRTPLMVAATFGSVDVVKLIISQPDVDVNRACGLDKCTALHCAASGGSVNVVDVVKLLLSVGSDPNIEDANGHRPFDVIIIPPKVPGIRAALEELLMNNVSDGSVGEWNLCLSIATSNSSSPTLSSSPDNVSPSSPSDSVSSPMASKYNDGPANSTSEKREYPIDPSLPDIKNSMYSTDEFRMFSFKVRPCSRAYSHDWTECPFVHPGENARRRDPRKYHYSCVPCPDFRKGACRRGDMCEYAHGVFECWLHPAQYRTRLCKDGTSCARRVCFFAHTAEELRPLYVNTGSAIPSPRSSALAASAMDMAAALSLLPGSPSSHSVMSSSPFNQPMSPSANCISHSSVAWQQPNVPTLHLPGSNLQSSRLRSSFSARDIPPEDLSILQDFDMQQQLLNDFSCLPQSRPSTISLNRSGRSNTLAPSNLEEFFSAEMTSSPRYSDLAAATGVFSPSHKSTVLSQFQQQQSILSPINTNVFSPKNVEHPLLQASFGVSSPGRMSPRSVEPISPMGARHSVFAQREKQHQQLRSLSSRDLGSNNVSTVGSPVNSSWSNWGSSNGKVDWSVKGDGMGRLRRSNSFELNNNGEEPDLSWVQSLVKESPPEMKEKLAVPISGTVPSGEGLKSNSQIDSVDHSVLGAWLEQMQLDQLVA